MDAARLRKTLYNVKVYNHGFDGTIRELNASGNRNFFIVIPIALASEMIAEGWPVKLVEVKFQTPINILKVTVPSNHNLRRTLTDEVDALEANPSYTCTIDILGTPWTYTPSNEPRMHGVKSYLISLDVHKTPPVMKYHMTASRGNSGLEGDYASLEEASDRLSAYGKSFPDEIIEVHITKINEE